jgi:hypothetical protein
MKKEDIIYDLVTDIKNDQNSIKEDIVDIKSNIHNHSVSLDRYNELLNVHIEGVRTLKQLHLDNVGRINVLEQPLVIEKAIQDHHKKIIGKAIRYSGLILTIISIIYTILHFD